MIKVLSIDEWTYDRNESTEERRRVMHLADEADQQGYRLLLPFELEWANPVKRAIWESMEGYQAGQTQKLMARKCNVVPVSRSVAGEFMDTNHVQGAVRNFISGWGLEDVNLGLVSVMTIGNAVNTAYDIELTRFCNANGVTVVGGASKLWKWVIGMHRGAKAITYSDRRYASGKLYGSVLGFTMIKRINPSYWYVGPDRSLGLLQKRRFRFHNGGRDGLFMKVAKGAQITAPGMLPGTYFQYRPDVPEQELMYTSGYRRFWDAGYVSWGQTLNG